MSSFTKTEHSNGEILHSLVTGYIHTHCSCISLNVNNIPLDIIKLCGKFYDESIIWNITNKRSKLLSLQTDECMHSTIIDYIGFKFRFTLQKILSPHTKKIIYSKYIELLSSPIEIHNVVVYVQVMCNETDNAWKISVPLSVCNNNKNTSKFAVGFITESAVQNNQTICFRNNLKILRINLPSEDDYKLINLDRYLLPKAKMHKKSKVEFTLDIEYVLSCEMRQTLFSPNCKDDVWCIQIKPWTRKQEPNCLLALRLLVLPDGVSKLNAVVTLTNSFAFCKKLSWIFSYNKPATGTYMNIQQMIGNGDGEVMTVTNTAEVQVTELYDMDEQLIPQKQWPWYGMI